MPCVCVLKFEVNQFKKMQNLKTCSTISPKSYKMDKSTYSTLFKEISDKQKYIGHTMTINLQ